jgi:molybdate transport system substrate-binding protein
MGLLGILETNTVTEEQDVTGITSKVALGEVDAGFAYVTDGKIVADQGVRIVPLPAGSQPKVRYQICAVTRGGADTVGAEAYIKKVTGYQGRRVLSEAGFGVPPHPSPDGRR